MAVDATRLLKAKSLFTLYVRAKGSGGTSRPWLYRGTALILSTLVVADSWFSMRTPTEIADSARGWLESGFSIASTFLAFLLAGFTFFASTISDGLLRDLSLHERADGQTWLEYNFGIYVVAFVDQLVVIAAHVGALLFFSSEGTIARGIMLLPCSNWYARVSCCAGAGAASYLLIRLLLRLYAFFFNVYHAAMTVFAWRLVDGEQDSSDEID